MRKLWRSRFGGSKQGMTGGSRRIRSSQLYQADDGTEAMLLGVDNLGRPCVKCGQPAGFAVVETPPDGGRSLGAPAGNRWVARALCAACLPAGIAEDAAANPFPSPAEAQEQFLLGAVH